MPNWMSVADAAAELDVDARQVRNLIASGALSAQRVGRAWAIDAASVRARSARPVPPGRPLSPGRAWQILAIVDAALRPGEAEVHDIEDRRIRHHLRGLLIRRPELEHWPAWLRHRAEHRQVWFHPAAAARLAEDPRVERADVSMLLGLPAGGLARLYVAADDVGGLIADHHGRAVGPGDDSDESLHLMVVPSEAPSWRAHVPAAAVVDLASDRDARVRHAALGVLGAAVDAALVEGDGAGGRA